MATTNRGYATPVTGSEVGTWGNVLNANAALIDNNLGGTTTVSLSSVSVTLNSAQYQCGTILLTGVLSQSVLVFFPNVSGWWTIYNGCNTGNFYVGARLASGGRVLGLPPGEAVDVLSDGTNMLFRNLGPNIGSYVDVAAATVPSWITNCTVPPYLACNGSSFNTSTYPVLFFILGTQFLPDTRGRVRANLNEGTSRITLGSGGIDGDSRFNGGGNQAITLGTNNLPAYTPTGSVSGSFSGSGTSTNAQTRNAQGGGDFAAFSPISPGTDLAVSVSGGISASFSGNAQGGSSTPFSLMQPTYIGGLTLIRAG